MSVEENHMIRKITPKKLWNAVKVYLSFWFSIFLKRPLHWGMPLSLSVEPTTSCNLRCLECPVGQKQLQRPAGNMRPELFRSCIDQLSDTLIYLMLYFQGEPFLYPGIIDMIRYASEKGIYTAVSTNGHHLDKDMARQIVPSGLDRLIVSLDGASQDTYEKYRAGGTFEKVVEGLDNLAGMKRLLNSRKPFLEIQFLVMGHNEHEIPEIRALGKKFGIPVSLKTIQIYNLEKNVRLIPQNPFYSRYIKDVHGNFVIKSRLPNRCFRMWSGAVMTWDGMVVPCCFDKNADHVMGTINSSEFREIWKGKNYAEFRLGILTCRECIDICRNCTEGLSN